MNNDKMKNKRIMQWLIVPIILTWGLYSFLFMEMNPYDWHPGGRIFSVFTLIFMYYVFAHVLFSNKK